MLDGLAGETTALLDKYLVVSRDLYLFQELGKSQVPIIVVVFSYVQQEEGEQTHITCRHAHKSSLTKLRHATEHLTGAGVVCCNTRYLDTLTHS